MHDSAYAATDEAMMARALLLARTAGPLVSPNPAVGAVLTADGQIIGEGVTAADGGPHAEVRALRSVAAAHRGRIPGSTLYVTLEPCSIYGRTPPCCDQLVRERVGRVVVGCIDFTAGVCGAGLERLRAGGVDVRIGALQDEAFALSAPRRTYVQLDRPYVILKQAVDARGYVGYASRPAAVTAAAANVVSHAWRAEVDAILVGVGTALTDDPQLTARHVAALRQPTRIVLDPRGRCNPSARLFDDAAPTLWAVDTQIAHELGPPPGVEVLRLEPAARVPSLLTQLHGRRVGRLLVEGGPETLRGFLSADAWDEYREWRASRTLAPADDLVPAADVPGDPSITTAVGPDLLRVTHQLTA